MDIAYVLKKEPGEMIVGDGLVATCSEVGDRKTGKHAEYGDWSLQPVMLTDESGKIRATVWNTEDVKPLLGQKVRVAATKGDKGWFGCQVEKNEYKGKSYMQLKVGGGVFEKYVFERYAPQTQQGTSAPPVNGHQSASQDGLTWDDYVEAMQRAHAVASDLEPEDGTARAALVNTAMIALTNGKVGMPPEAPAMDDEIPF